MSISMKKISELNPHPRNEEIYGYNEDISELVEKIRKSGVVTTLTITDDNVIIAGNRRWKSCKQLVSEGDTRFCQVMCEVKNFDNEWDALEYLVINNDTRTKTMEQRAREAQILIETEKKKSEQRMLSGRKIDPVAEPPQGTGKTRDIVAKKLHMKSGREVERAVKAVETIDKLKSEGRHKDADLISDTLNNTSVSTAADLSSHIDDLSEDEKQAIRDKKISAYKAITKHVTQRTPKTTDNMTAEQREALAHKQACKEAVEEYIAQSMGLINIPDESSDTHIDDSIVLFDTSVRTFTTAVSNISGLSSSFSHKQRTKVLNIISDVENKINMLKKSLEV